MDLKKEILEGNDVGTSPTNSESEIGLNNSTVPTQQEQENANIQSDTNPVAEEEENQSSIIGDTVVEDEGLEPEEDPASEINAEDDGLTEGAATKTFTQSQVDEIAGKIRKETREKVTRDIYSRYGVNTADELDELFSDAQRFATSQEDFAGKEKAWREADELRTQELNSVKERVALLESGIDRNRFEDASLILRGKGLEVTAENIAAELATHPEWKKEMLAPNPVEEAGLPFRKNSGTMPEAQPVAEPATKISIPTFGNNSADNPQPELSERERALRMFKV